MLISNMLKFWLYVDFESSYERTQIMGRQFDAFDIVPQVGMDTTMGYQFKDNFMLISNYGCTSRVMNDLLAVCTFDIVPQVKL